jgi:hypothetical protein
MWELYLEWRTKAGITAYMWLFETQIDAEMVLRTLEDHTIFSEIREKTPFPRFHDTDPLHALEIHKQILAEMKTIRPADVPESEEWDE